MLLEKDLADLKSSFEYQSKVHWWAMGLAGTLFASLPVALQTVNSVDEKQKRLGEKYKGLKSRLVRMEVTHFCLFELLLCTASLCHV